MTTAKPAAAPQPGTDAHPVTRLISATGTVQPATPRDAEQWLAAREFFWLDLECLDDERLEQFGRSLHLGASGIAMPEDTWQAPGPGRADVGSRAAAIRGRRAAGRLAYLPVP
jgi:hypothetical protein